MITRSTYRILIWAIVILVATNVSMAISLLYSKQQNKTTPASKNENTTEVPAVQRTRFFREALNLSPQQVMAFRDLSREFNRKGQQISSHLQQLRFDMVAELGQSEPDSIALEQISTQIGELHTELKMATIAYYLELKAICNTDQQEKLNEVFNRMLRTQEDVSLPRRGHRYRGKR